MCAGRTVLALAWVATAAAATDGLSLLDLPVAGSVPVAATRYQAALSQAPRGAGPVELALRVAGPFEGANQLIAQANGGSESPSGAHVTLVRDGLLDDALRSERWDITLVRTAAGRWQVTAVTRAWRCRRGGQTEAFATQRCP
jgi:hypothetical protein